MSENNSHKNQEYVMICVKCGAEYPMGTSYCTNPLCRANLAIYGNLVQKNAALDVDAACRKIEQMMEEVMFALSGKSFEAEKRTNYQNGFNWILENARTAKTYASLQDCLQQAEQWKESCLNEIILLGESLESVREQAKTRITRARETVMSALAGKRREQEMRKGYGAQYNAIWMSVTNSEDREEILAAAARAEMLMQQFLAEISRLSEEDVSTSSGGGTIGGTTGNDSTTGGNAGTTGRTAGSNSGTVSGAVGTNGGTAGSSAGTAGGTAGSRGGMTGGTAGVNSGTTGGNAGTMGGIAGGNAGTNGRTAGGNGGMTAGTTINGGTPDPQYAANLQREKQRAQKRIDAAMDKVLKALSKKKQGDQYRDKYAVGFKNISARMQQCRTLEEVNIYAVQAETLRDSDLIEIKGMKNKFGVGKSILLVLLVIFVLGFIEGVVTSVMDLSSGSSQGSGNSSGGTGGRSGTGDDDDSGSGSTWENNVLMSNFYGWDDEREETDWPVFDSDEWVRGDITSIVFLDTLDNESAGSWDVSEAQDGSVKAWVEESGSNTILYIAGDGGVSAPEDSEGLFVGYGAESIEFGSAFHTDVVKSMRFMFEACKNLQTVDVSGWDTSNVTDMSYMFDACTSLVELDLTGLDTSKVKDMSFMFFMCYSLEEVDVTGFDTSNVTNMCFMFSFATELQTVDISGFDFSNVTNAEYMFSDCYDLRTIGNAEFDFSNIADTDGMFDCCDSLDTSNLTGY